MKMLNVSEGYRIWAPTYSEETAISFLEDKLVRKMTPPLEGLNLLDAGCGTGRRLRGTRAVFAVGLEPNAAMIAAGKAKNRDTDHVEIVTGDVRNMPFASRTFDVVWCRLVLGHLAVIDQSYRELARVAQDGAKLIVTDFHPAAVAAGHCRSFRVGGKIIELEHYVHASEDHIEAALSAGFRIEQIRDAAIGNDVRPFYQSAHKLEVYPDHLGLPVVLALSFRRVH